MDCKHELHLLIGMADGIHCTGCGKVFATMEEIAPKEPEEKPKKKGGRKRADA